MVSLLSAGGCGGCSMVIPLWFLYYLLLVVVAVEWPFFQLHAIDNGLGIFASYKIPRRKGKGRLQCAAQYHESCFASLFFAEPVFFLLTVIIGRNLSKQNTEF